MENSIVEIDGSLFEGGGQMIRYSLALSNVLKKPFKMINIRKQRPNKGLNYQLLSQLNFMKKIMQSDITNDQLNSQIIVYNPKELIQENFDIECETAASIALMFQSILPSVLFSKKNFNFKIKGGTVVSHAPSCHSIQRILKLYLQQMGISFNFEILKDGYYPKGNGLVAVSVEPIKDFIKPINLIQKEPIQNIYIEMIHNIQDDDDNSMKEIYQIDKKIKKVIEKSYEKKENQFEIDFQIQQKKQTSNQKKKLNYYACLLFASGIQTGYDSSIIFTKDNQQNISGQILKKFKQTIEPESCVDEHIQDQLLIFMVLAKGKSQILIGDKITTHTQSALYIFKQFIPNLEYEFQEKDINNKKSIILQINGIGLINQE